MKTDAWLKLDNQLCFALYSASRAMTAAYKPLLDPLGLTYPQYLAMLVLWERDGLRMAELGDRLHLDSGTLTPLVKRLEANGLVTRRRREEDERELEISLTRSGRALRKRALDVPARLACRTGRSAAELSRVREELLKLIETLNEKT